MQYLKVDIGHSTTSQTIWQYLKWRFCLESRLTIQSGLITLTGLTLLSWTTMVRFLMSRKKTFPHNTTYIHDHSNCLHDKRISSPANFLTKDLWDKWRISDSWFWFLILEKKSIASFSKKRILSAEDAFPKTSDM